MYLYIACMSTNVEGRGILEYNPLHHIHHSSMYNKTIIIKSHHNRKTVNVSELACDWNAGDPGKEKLVVKSQNILM